MKTVRRLTAAAGILAMLVSMSILSPRAEAAQGGIIGAMIITDTNTTTTTTDYGPRRVGDVLLGGSVAQYDTIWISKGITTASWVKLSTYAQAEAVATTATGAVYTAAETAWQADIATATGQVAATWAADIATATGQVAAAWAADIGTATGQVALVWEAADAAAKLAITNSGITGNVTLVFATDGITCQWNYAHGICTNVYSNSVSIAP
ncbi:MAG: hypothetical protein WC485_07780 [Opitutaceae bacterium]